MVNKKLSKIISVATAGVMIFTLSACSLFGGNVEEETPAPASVALIESMSEMSQNSYALAIDEEAGKIALPYWGTATFDTTAAPEGTQGNPSRVVWFNDDNWNSIPTIHKGDSILYRYNQEFEESFKFERFYDLGYTLGIYGLTESDTGRYKLSTSDEDAKINMSSDAAKLAEIEDTNITIESISSAKIRSGMISPAGTILGLKQNNTYELEVYTGTEYYTEKVPIPDTKEFESKIFALKADSRALYSSEIAISTEYEFIKDVAIKISIPEWFNSGYYSVNNSGIFRYIASDEEFSEDMDMNIPNAATTDDAMAKQEISEAIDYAQSFIIQKTGNYTIVAKVIGDTKDIDPRDWGFEEDYKLEAPVLTLQWDTGGGEVAHVTDKIATLHNDGDNTYSATFDANMTGTCKLVIENAYGRDVEMSIIYNDYEEGNTPDIISIEEKEVLTLPTYSTGYDGSVPEPEGFEANTENSAEDESETESESESESETLAEN